MEKRVAHVSLLETVDDSAYALLEMNDIEVNQESKLKIS